MADASLPRGDETSAAESVPPAGPPGTDSPPSEEEPRLELATTSSGDRIKDFALALSSGAATYPSMQITRAPEYQGSDPEVERKEYVLSLLPKNVQDQHMAEEVWTPREIQRLIQHNTALKLVGEDHFILEGDLVFEIDKHIRDPIFVTSATKVYTEEELLRTYPFEEIGTSPRDVFAQQELGVFPARYSTDPNAREHQVRDLGSKEEFITIEDLVGRHARVDYEDKRPIIAAVKTKIFLARSGWEDFQVLTKQLRVIARFGAGAAEHAARSNRPNFLALMMGGMTGGAAAGGTMALENAELIQQRVEQARKEMEERERRMKEREEELARKTEELLAMLADL